MVIKYKKQILDLILKKIEPDHCVVFLFGSHARGLAVKGSDIDIGLLTTHPLDPRVFLEIGEDLNNHVSTLRKIDLVDFRTVDKKVRKEALKEVAIWHRGKNCYKLLKNLKQA